MVYTSRTRLLSQGSCVSGAAYSKKTKWGRLMGVHSSLRGVPRFGPDYFYSFSIAYALGRYQIQCRFFTGFDFYCIDLSTPGNSNIHTDERHSEWPLLWPANAREIVRKDLPLPQVHGGLIVRRARNLLLQMLERKVVDQRAFSMFK